MNKKIFFLSFLLILAAHSAFAQCKECNSFTEALKKPEQVKSLIINSHIHRITLDSVPASVGRFINIEILYFTDQNITAIPQEIAGLKKLKELSFAACKLTSVPDFIFSMSHLKEILLNDNLFTEEYKKSLEQRFKKELPGVMVSLE